MNSGINHDDERTIYEEKNEYRYSLTFTDVFYADEVAREVYRYL